MKEITRIHLAKTPYSIEKGAQKELSRYSDAVRRSLSDDEAEAVMADIELRMVELLAEQDVQAEGVVAMDDVRFLEERLGEPTDFLEEGEEKKDVPNEMMTHKRLYRDEDNAILGGVAAGFAAYFGVDKVWVRLAFVVLTLISFGTGIFLYIVLWIITPPARTAAERLQMEGKPVTLESLKAHGAAAIDKVKEQGHIAKHTGQVLLTITGVITALCALGAFMATVFGAVAMLAFIEVHGLQSTMAYLSWGLHILAGLMLTWLLIGGAVALFQKRLSRVIRSILIATAAVGACAFFAAVIASWYAFGTINIPQNDLRIDRYMEVPQADVRSLMN